jgi:hypothetical protein
MKNVKKQIRDREYNINERIHDIYPFAITNDVHSMRIQVAERIQSAVLNFIFARALAGDHEERA